MANINANLKMERKWVNGGCTVMAAAGQTFGNSRPGSVPAWVPDSAAAQPPARHGPFFQYVELLKRRFIKSLEFLAQRTQANEPTIAEWWPLIWATDID
eukprot:8289666-Pyramimonas_sp.AAC.1